MKFIYLLFLCLINISAVQAAESSWVDLPYFNLNDTTLVHDHSFDKINSMITEYHAITKTEFKLFNKRIQKLHDIANYISSYLQQNSQLEKFKANIFSKISSIASKKALYLQQIIEYYRKYDDQLSSLKSYFHDFDNHSSLKQLPLYDGILFSSNLGHNVGYFWLEAIDPGHRALIDYRTKWENEKIKTKFFVWLEGQYILPYDELVVLYPDEETLNREYKIQISHGKILTYSSPEKKYKFLDNHNEVAFLFIIRPNQDIMLGAMAKNFHHSSLCRGKPIVGGGSIWAKNGLVTKIFLNSGHYLPKFIHYKQTLDIFIAQGMKINSDTIIKYYDGPKVQEVSYKDFSIIIDQKIKESN